MEGLSLIQTRSILDLMKWFINKLFLVFLFIQLFCNTTTQKNFTVDSEDYIVKNIYGESLENAIWNAKYKIYEHHVAIQFCATGCDRMYQNNYLALGMIDKELIESFEILDKKVTREGFYINARGTVNKALYKSLQKQKSFKPKAAIFIESRFPNSTSNLEILKIKNKIRSVFEYYSIVKQDQIDDELSGYKIKSLKNNLLRTKILSIAKEKFDIELLIGIENHIFSEKDIFHSDINIIFYNVFDGNIVFDKSCTTIPFKKSANILFQSEFEAINFCLDSLRQKSIDFRIFWDGKILNSLPMVIKHFPNTLALRYNIFYNLLQEERVISITDEKYENERLSFIINGFYNKEKLLYLLATRGKLFGFEVDNWKKEGVSYLATWR